MVTETLYLIGPGVKWLKTRVSISSDVNDSAIGTEDIKKTHIYYCYIYTLSCKFYLSRVTSCFICNNIQTFVYDAVLIFAIQKRYRAHAEELQRAQHESGLIMIEERTKHSNICLHFRPVAVAANFILASKHYSHISSFPSQQYTLVPP